MKRRIPLISRERLMKCIEFGLSRPQMAALEKVSVSLIHVWVKRHGLIEFAQLHRPETPSHTLKQRFQAYGREAMAITKIAKIEGRIESWVEEKAHEFGITLKRMRPLTYGELNTHLANGLTHVQIAELVGQKPAAIRARILKLDVAPKRDIKRYMSEEYKKQLQDLAGKGLTLRQMAKEIKCNVATVSLHLRHHDIPYVVERKRRVFDPQKVAALIEQGLTYAAIAKESGGNRTTVQKYAEKHGLIPKVAKRRAYIRSLDNREMLQALVEKEMTTEHMAMHLNICKEAVNRLLRKHGLTAHQGIGWKGGGNSPPCDHLREILRAADIPIHPECRPIKGRKYSIDIPFPEAKLGIEVNGTFHYSDVREETLSPYHQTRHDLIVAAGWRLIEVPYKRVWDKRFVDGLIETIRKALDEVPKNHLAPLAEAVRL